MRSEKEKMLAGEPYDPEDPQLAADRRQARAICRELAALGQDDARARELLARLLGRDTDARIVFPFQCDYGYNLRLGRNAYFNVGCVVLDVAVVTIGDNFLAGPGVHLYTASHPMGAADRRRGIETGAPVTIGDDVWLGGRVVVLPGVSIGPAAVIGAGSVVTADIPGGVFAAGNPCRVIRELS